MLKFLHAADFHLDSPFSSLSSRQAAAARQDQRDLMLRFVQEAKERAVDLVLIAGDLFDSAHIYPETIELLHELFEELSIPIFISPGNHDPYTKSSPYACEPWPAHVHIFQTPTVTRIALPDLGCKVYGSAFCENARLDSPLAGLAVEGDGLQLGCFHADLAKKNTLYGPLPLEALRESGLHYVALGHVHACSDLQREGRVFYAYPGCPQGRGFDETGSKGCYYGEMDEDGSVELSFLTLAQRHYESWSLTLGAGSVQEQLRAILPPVPTDDIGRIFLRGERFVKELPLDELEAMAKPLFFSVALIDESRYVENLRLRESEDSLVGRFLRELRPLTETGTPEQAALYELAARYGVAALEGREEPQ